MNMMQNQGIIIDKDDICQTSRRYLNHLEQLNAEMLEVLEIIGNCRIFAYDSMDRFEDYELKIKSIIKKNKAMK